MVIVFPQAKRIRPRRFMQGQPFNTTADQVHDFDVPDGKLWEVLKACCESSDSATRTAVHYDKENKNLGYIFSISAGTGGAGGPSYNNSENRLHHNILAWETDYIRFSFGASQSSAWVCLEVLEYELSEIMQKK